jgi:hypothetical protein
MIVRPLPATTGTSGEDQFGDRAGHVFEVPVVMQHQAVLDGDAGDEAVYGGSAPRPGGSGSR